MKQKQYKLRFKPTPISRLLRRSKLPIKMVGYPVAHEWARYYALNYEFMLREKRDLEETLMKRKAAEIEYGSGPFIDDYAAA